MAPKYKLTYFPVKALGEPIRFLLSYGNIEFEDDRFEREKWPSIKSSMPFGQVPVLEFDGKKAHQSIAICRYLGKQLKLAGDNDWEALQIDMAADCLTDLRMKLGSFFYESDEAVKEKKKAPIINEFLPFFLPRLDNMVKENGGYLANGKLSWADFYFAGILDYVNHMAGFDITKDYANLAALNKKMSPTCKLTYFDAMGIGEPIRFLLRYGKIEFEDIRCDFEKWPSMKSSTPFGKLPLLEIDGKKMHQSIAICRYLGKKLGLAGENDWESAQIDMAVDTVTDLRMKVTECYWEPDEAIKKKKKETLLNETLPFYLERLDGMVKENGGYLAAGKLSWADFFFAGVSDYMDCVVQFDITKDHPNLAAIKKKICELPAIKDWISKRPKTSL